MTSERTLANVATALIANKEKVAAEQKQTTAQQAKDIGSAKILVKGLGASPGVGVGKVKLILSPKEIKRMEKGDILVTEMTTPDFVPAMKKAAAIITDTGGTTSHAAIVSRELGIPCIVGTTNATKILAEGMDVTADGSHGVVYEGILQQQRKRKMKNTQCYLLNQHQLLEQKFM